MSLKLCRVELTNIRSHKHVVFEPEASGITALQGPNGMGKSTIVDSIAWALYGTKPNGVSKANEIFRAGIGEKDKAFAKVDLEIDGKLMRFERRRVNKHGAIEVEVFSVENNEAGEPIYTNVAGPAITHAESYIRKLMRMDEKGFLAAVLIQQKQVDQLISTGPRERGQVIEKLTGIAGITAAVTESKQELNSLKKAASFSTIDELALQKLKDDEQRVHASALELKGDLDILKGRAGELKRTGEGLKVELEEATKLFDRKNAIERTMGDLTVKKGLKEEDLAQTLEEKEKAKKELVGLGTESVDELQKLISEKSSERDKLSLLKGRSEDKLEELKLTIAEKEGILEELKEATSGDPVKLRAEVEKKLEEIQKLKDEMVEARGEKQKLLQAIQVIEKGDGCPTCLQKVADVSVATKALYSTIDTLTENAEGIQAKAEELKAESTSIAAQIADIQRKQEASEWLSTAANQLKETKKSLDGASGELRLVEKELSVLRKRMDEARQEQLKKQAHQRILEKAQRLTTELEEIDFQLGKLKKESGELGPSSQREINSLQRKLDEMRSKYSSASMEYTSKNGELKLQAQKRDHLRQEIQRHENEIAKHNELLKSVSVAAHAHEVISEFREERIKNSIPVIEVYASDLLNRFTEGKFTRLSLNQKFEATVYLSDGTPRAVGLLSGGELSAAAMALRLAISMLLNSGAGQNLIILDEVLVSQDTNRAEQILTTLKEVARGQVVLIAHNEAIDSVADRIVTLGRENGDGETTAEIQD